MRKDLRRASPVLGQILFFSSLFFVNWLRYMEELSDDDQWSLWKATMMRWGDVPFRDFVIVGDPLDMFASWIFQSIFGNSALGEYVLAALVLTLGTWLFSRAAARYALSWKVSAVLYLGLFLSALRIDIHSTPKHLVLALATWTVVRILFRASGVALASFTCGIAFLYRHDFLLVVVPAISLAFVLRYLGDAEPWRRAWAKLWRTGAWSASVLVYYFVLVAVVSGSFTGVKTYLQDYISIEKTKSMSSSKWLSREVAREALVDCSAFADSLVNWVSLVKGVFVVSRYDIAFRTSNPGALLEVKNEADRLCNLNKDCEPRRVEISYTRPEATALKIGDFFDSKFIEGVRNLARPVPGRYVANDGEIRITWEIPTSDPRVLEAEKQWGLKTADESGIYQRTYNVRGASPSANWMALASHPDVRILDFVSQKPDVELLRKDWKSFLRKDRPLNLLIDRELGNIDDLVAKLQMDEALYRLDFSANHATSTQLLKYFQLEGPGDFSIDRESRVVFGPIRSALRSVQKGLRIVPYSWSYLWMWLFPLFTAAFLCFRGWYRGTWQQRAVIAVAALWIVANAVLVRWFALAPVYASLPLVWLCIARQSATGKQRRFLSWALASWFFFLGLVVTGDLELPREFYEFRSVKEALKSKIHDARGKPRLDVTFERESAFRYIEHYLHRCMRSEDRVFVVGDKMSIPYATQRRIYRSTNWHEGIGSDPASQEKVVRELNQSREIPFFVSEIHGGPLAGLSQNQVRAAVRKNFGNWIQLNESVINPTQEFWIGFSKNYRFGKPDKLTGWPCAAPKPPAAPPLK